jgi:hypothetical protein
VRDSPGMGVEVVCPRLRIPKTKKNSRTRQRVGRVGGIDRRQGISPRQRETRRRTCSPFTRPLDFWFPARTAPCGTLRREPGDARFVNLTLDRRESCDT